MQRAATRLITQLEREAERDTTHGRLRADCESRQAIVCADDEQAKFLVLALVGRLKRVESGAFWTALPLSQRCALRDTLSLLLRRNLCYRPAELATLLDWLCCGHRHMFWDRPCRSILRAVENHAKSHSLTSDIELRLQAFRRKLDDPDPTADQVRLMARIDEILGGTRAVLIKPDEVWADAAIADLSEMEAASRVAWNELLRHGIAPTSTRPSGKWLDRAGRLVGAIGETDCRHLVLKWLELVPEPRSEAKRPRRYRGPNYRYHITTENSDLLRGLIWICGQWDDIASARVLGRLGEAMYRKLPGEGPVNIKLGNACVVALGLMPGQPGIAQLAGLKSKIKYVSAQKTITRALEQAARRAGITPEELEETSTPTLGFTEVGRYQRTVGDYTALVTVEDTSTVALRWRGENGKLQKTAPKALKEDRGEEIKELKQLVKDVRKTLPALRDRLETLRWGQQSWDLATWRERYLDHPLMGSIARRLIWEFQERDGWTAGAWADGQIVGDNDRSLDRLQDQTTVRLWHPLGQNLDAITAWRNWLERHEVRQPFKQAHRELYLLTDAEIDTGAYSNRFASHLIKQHQFNALCRERGWRYSLQGCWDGGDPVASLELPGAGIRAEFWVEPVGEYPADATEMGVLLYVTTDQVRFHAIDSNDPAATTNAARSAGEPLPLLDVPARVFSEVMRDVDLFVGVCSVGNDPEWQDRGDELGYRDYWRDFSFGDLGASALTRREVLERLVPRLKIADRCSLTDKYLVVRGDLRTYRIHLGSSNILMEPGGQYLCIVPGRGQSTLAIGSVYLPFEGDRTLSIILSKAFMLAGDWKIKDKTIRHQIDIS